MPLAYTIPKEIVTEKEGGMKCPSHISEPAYRLWLQDNWDGLQNPSLKADITWFLPAIENIKSNQEKLERLIKAKNNLEIAKCTIVGSMGVIPIEKVLANIRFSDTNSNIRKDLSEILKALAETNRKFDKLIAYVNNKLDVGEQC